MTGSNERLAGYLVALLAGVRKSIAGIYRLAVDLSHYSLQSKRHVPGSPLGCRI